MFTAIYITENRVYDITSFTTKQKAVEYATNIAMKNSPSVSKKEIIADLNEENEYYEGKYAEWSVFIIGK